jgi:hypothetical protein
MVKLRNGASLWDLHIEELGHLRRGNGAPSRIRTCDLRIRSPSLYPTELWAQKIKTIFPYGNGLYASLLWPEKRVAIR